MDSLGGTTQNRLSVDTPDFTLPTAQPPLSEGALAQQKAMEREMIAASVIAQLKEEGALGPYQPVQKPLRPLRMDGPRRCFLTPEQWLCMAIAWGTVAIGAILLYFTGGLR